MKSKEFITEAAHIRQVILSKEMIDTLHNECSEYLDNASKALYRGFYRGIERGLSKVPIRTDRKPKDSKTIDTAGFNYVFEEMTGVPYIRNITAFAVMTYKIASTYGVGNVGMVFPTNGTQFLHSPDIEDVYTKFQDKGYELNNVAHFYARDHMIPWKIENDIDNHLDRVWKLAKERHGRVTVAEVNKILGKYLPVWKMFVEQFEALAKKYYHYDGFHLDLNKSKEEIAFFGKPYYYTLKIDRMYDGSSQDYQMTIGDKQFKTLPKPEVMANILLNAIQHKQEISIILKSEK